MSTFCWFYPSEIVDNQKIKQSFHPFYCFLLSTSIWSLLVVFIHSLLLLYFLPSSENSSIFLCWSSQCFDFRASLSDFYSLDILRNVSYIILTWMLFERTQAHLYRGQYYNLLAVINGSETGKQGKIVGIQREQNRVHIEGVNMRRRTQKSPSPGVPGNIITYPGGIHVSNIQLIDPESQVPTKIWRRYTDEGHKIRVSKVSGSIIEKPEWKREKPRSVLTGPKDTEPDDVYKVTYEYYEAKLHKSNRKKEIEETSD